MSCLQQIHIYRGLSRMKDAAQPSSKIVLTVCYILSALLMIAMVAALVMWIADDNLAASLPLSNAPNYAIEEINMWNVESIPAPEDFLNEEGKSFVKNVQYAAPPSYSVGAQTVALIMTLEDGTIRTENALLTISEAAMVWEMATEATPEALLGKMYADAQFEKPITDYKQPGTYTVQVKFGEKSYPFALTVQDTKPPIGKIKEKLTFCTNQELTMDDFLISYEDASDVTVKFSELPDTTSNGTKTTQIVLTDAYDNVSILPVSYTITGDDTPPILTGCVDLTTIIGVPLSYTHNVTATDNKDGELEYTITLSDDFNFNAEGQYTIRYDAEDAAGNSVSETVRLNVLPADTDLTKIPNEMYMLMGYYIVDEMLKNAPEDMDEQELAYKCYRYVQDHMYFVDNNEEYEDLDTQWMYPAALAIRQKYGDCRNYYGFARLLYTCAGLENIMVFHPANYEGADRHWWNMVKISGAWYHCDPTPRVAISDFFMKTDEWMDAYSARNGNCFKRDKSLYPATPSPNAPATTTTVTTTKTRP